MRAASTGWTSLGGGSGIGAAHDDVEAKPFDLADERGYQAWRERKLAEYPRCAEDLRLEIARLDEPSAAEMLALTARCRRANMAIYTATAGATPAGPDQTRASIRGLSAAFGLSLREDHRSAEDDGIVAIEVSETSAKRGFIPYTRKALNWHTDGYYNPVGAPIRAMLLHCVRPAASGGENALLDPEIAYLRLRDRSPALAAAMMHPEAMTIPQSVEEDGSVRPTVTGPVFIVENGGRRLTTRYTARTRNIHWRDDDDTRAAVALLDRLLAHQEEPLILTYRLNAGEGLLCNNVMHTRTSFEEDGSGRLLYRVRYRDRIAGT